MHEDIASTQLSQSKKSKTTIRVQHNRENHFVMINKAALRNPSLSLKARGLWAYLLSFPDDWEFNVAHLIASLPEGRTAIYSAFDELIKHGFLIRLQYHGCKDHGTVGFQKLQYIVFEFPTTPDEREKKYQEFQKNCIHSGQIKNNSVHSGFVNTRRLNTGNQHLLNIDKEPRMKEEEEYAPPDSDAPPPLLSDPPKQKAAPKVPFKNSHLTERMILHPQASSFTCSYKRPLVGIEDSDHDALVAKYGEAVIAEAYQQLADWKISKVESGNGKEVIKHTDLHRLKKWVIKVIIESHQSHTKYKTIPAIETLNTHITFANALKKKYENHPKLTFGTDYVEFDNGRQCAHFKLSEKDFISKCKIELNKKGLDTNI